MSTHGQGSSSHAAAERPGILARLNNMDRRWIFLAMALMVAAPIIWVSVTGKTFPENPTAPVRGAFEMLENLPDNARVLISFDYDPASAGELQPMATAVVNHCASRGYRICMMTLWAPGTPLAQRTYQDVIERFYPGKYKEGINFVDLGYQAGNEGVIKLMSTNLAKAYETDRKGTPLSQLPMMQGIEKTSDFDALISISAGQPGAREWVQYAVSPTLTGGKKLPFFAGSTGVQTPQLIPYYPRQMVGILGAIKGAAEYEYLVNESMRKRDPAMKAIPPELQEAQRRMAPQLTAHVLMVVLIILGNLIYFSQRKAARA